MKKFKFYKWMYCFCESNNLELTVFFTVPVLQQKLQLHEQKCNFFADPVDMSIKILMAAEQEWQAVHA